MFADDPKPKKSKAVSDRDLREALLRLCVRSLEYVGIDPHPDAELAKLLDCDNEMRELALQGLALLKVDARVVLRRHLREKKLAAGQRKKRAER